MVHVRTTQRIWAPPWDGILPEANVFARSTLKKITGIHWPFALSLLHWDELGITQAVHATVQHSTAILTTAVRNDKRLKNAESTC